MGKWRANQKQNTTLMLQAWRSLERLQSIRAAKGDPTRCIRHATGSTHAVVEHKGNGIRFCEISLLSIAFAVICAGFISSPVNHVCIPPAWRRFLTISSRWRSGFGLVDNYVCSRVDEQLAGIKIVSHATDFGHVLNIDSCCAGLPERLSSSVVGWVLNPKVQGFKSLPCNYLQQPVTDCLRCDLSRPTQLSASPQRSSREDLKNLRFRC